MTPVAGGAGSLSLTAKLYAWLAAVVLIVSAAHAVVSQVFERAQIERTVREHCERLAKRLEVSLRRSVWEYDRATIHDTVLAEMAEPVLAGVVVRSSIDDRLLCAVARDVDGAVVETEGPPALAGLIETERTITQVENGRRVVVGSVSVHLDPAVERQDLLSAFLTETLEGLILLVAVLVIVGVVFGPSLVQPLELLRRRMVATADAVRAHGDIQSLATEDPLAGRRGIFAEVRAMGRGFQAAVAAVVEAQRALRENEAGLRTTLDSIGDGVVATDTLGRVLRMNRVAEALSGWHRADARGKLLGEVLDFRDEERGRPVAATLEQALAGDRVEQGEGRLVLRSRDGSQVRVVATASPVRGPGGAVEGMVVVIRDVTARVRLETELRQAQKMESIGQLAGGIAHDFNNMLTGIMGSADFLRARLKDEPRLLRLADTILDAAARAGDLTGQLLAFSRRSGADRRPVDGHAAIDAAIALLERSIDPRIRIERSLGARRHVINGNGGQIENALINLAVNARDAMPDGGRLTFRTCEVEIDAGHEQARAFGLEPGSYLRIEVSDTGCGIDPAVRDRIFEPFFTTKDVGQGTGLGLAAVYGTVREHRGAIGVDSTPGVGSTFYLLLPLVAAVVPSSTRSTDGEPFDGRGLQVLIVDDEEVVREMATSLFEELGFVVETASDGQAGLEAFHQHRSRLRLVVLDLAMPRLSGQDVLTRIRALDAVMPVLLVSGFIGDTDLARLVDDPHTSFVAKPYRLKELVRTLQDLGLG